MINVNLGCGPVFVDSPQWLNLDFSPSTSAVRQANLLDRLPLADEFASLVYSSHFLEHVPRALVAGLLQECLRVLKPGGVMRIVVPDLENLAREYLAMRDKGEHVKANFVVLEMIDQCVRQVSGGELGKLYRQLNRNPRPAMIDYIRVRTGEDLHEKDTLKKYWFGELGRMVRALPIRIQRYWIYVCLLLLPAAFRSQNVSLAAVGERHQWIWDFHQIKAELEAVGFTDVQRLSAYTSAVSDFPFYPLDADKHGQPRKGAESMYIEARKPRTFTGKL